MIRTALTDALGNMIGFRLLPGQAHDLRGTAALIEGGCGQSLADRASDASWFREVLTGIEALIPPESNRRFPAGLDRDTCQWRHLIGNVFEKLNEYRGIAIRRCEPAESVSAFICLAAAVIRTR
ncbi:hypothetical protein [Actibacterium sp. D379-3]